MDLTEGFTEVVAANVAAATNAPRAWLIERILRQLEEPDCRYVLVQGETGAGKTVVAALLASQQPGWIPYFLRKDSVTPLGASDLQNFLLSVGYQLAARLPELFDPKRLEVVIRQRIEQTTEGGSVTAADIDVLFASPFYKDVKTVVRIDQDIKSASGDVAAIKLRSLHVDPRILEPEILQNLAIIYPAEALKEIDGEAQIIVLIDGLDEAVRFSGNTIGLLDWLDSGPELPPNVRFVITSRPETRVDRFVRRRQETVRVVTINSKDPMVRADLKAHAQPLLDELAPRGIDGKELDVDQLVDKADGNFAYLAAFGRALSEARRNGDVEYAARLLNFATLPTGLHDLYLLFLERLEDDVARLGDLDIENPTSAHASRIPAWEGVGRRLVAVLAVALEPISLDQMIRFGDVAVGLQDAATVLERLSQFLDTDDGRSALFHGSLAEFITSDELKTKRPSLWIDSKSWVRRLLRSYRVSGETWDGVSWYEVDTYGLRHIAEHLVALGDAEARSVVQLVTAAMRGAMLQRFGDDLAFAQLIALALDRVRLDNIPRTALPDLLFLELVLAQIRTGSHRLSPEVLSLMVRLGRAREAITYAQLMGSGQQKLSSLIAIRQLLATSESGPTGDEITPSQLVESAMDVPTRWRTSCLAAVAPLIASYDLKRAIELADFAEEGSSHQVRDAVFRQALIAAKNLPMIKDLLSNLSEGRSAAILDVLAERRKQAQAPEIHLALLELAETHLSEELAETQRHLLLARLAAGWHEFDSAKSDGLALDLFERIAELAVTASDATWVTTAVKAAHEIDTVNRELAVKIVDSVDSARQRLDGTQGWRQGYSEAARFWGEVAEESKCFDDVRAVSERVRKEGHPFVRGPDLAELGTVVSQIDPGAAQRLIDESIQIMDLFGAGLLGPLEAAGLNDCYRKIVEALLAWKGEREWPAVPTLPWHVDRAVTTAFKMRGQSWVSGIVRTESPDSLSTLARIGLCVIDQSRGFASVLLDRCLDEAPAEYIFGRPDSNVPWTWAFRPVAAASNVDGLAATIEAFGSSMSFVTNVMNVFGNWHSERMLLFVPSPMKHLRRLQRSSYSWAGAVRALLEQVAQSDVDKALNCVPHLVDKGEQAIALAYMAHVMYGKADPRFPQTAQAAFDVANQLPPYDLAYKDSFALFGVQRLTNERAAILAYMNPTSRVQLEVAWRLPRASNELAARLAGQTSPYMNNVLAAERFIQFAAELPGASESAQDYWTRGLEAMLQFADAGHAAGDLLIASQIRLAAGIAMTRLSEKRAVDVIESIPLAPYRAFGRLTAALVALESDPTALIQRCNDIVNELLSEGASPCQKAYLLAFAANLVGSIGADPDGFLDRAVETSRAQDPYHSGLALLSVIELMRDLWPSRRASRINSRLLIQEVMDLSHKVQTPPSFGDLDWPGELLAGALSWSLLFEPDLATTIFLRLLAIGWPSLMAAIEQVGGNLVASCGLDTPQRLHRAVLAALETVRDQKSPTPQHIDGVSYSYLPE